jgi:MoaA/NifB/PqqE/SkfB family radical SAM enzyme
MKLKTLYSFIQGILNKKKIDSIIFFITARCNSRCKTCFFWKNLNKKKDLSLKEISSLLKKLPKIENVLISGGEPFLREDISEIISEMVKINNIKAVGIPTNCLLEEKILSNTEKILQENPGLRLEINCSLDGLKKEHDFIRGVNGNFNRTISTIKKLNVLKKKYPSLKVTVNTVITNRNYLLLSSLIEHVKSLGVDSHTFDVLRGFHQGILSLPTLDKFKKINNLRYKTRKYYNKKKPWFLRMLYNLREKEIILTQQDVLSGKKWGFGCIAGKNHITLGSEGLVQICELNPPVGDLKKQPLQDILKNVYSKRISDQIKGHQCDCTHICYVSGSINKSLSALTLGLIKAVFRKI